MDTWMICWQFEKRLPDWLWLGVRGWGVGLVVWTVAKFIGRIICFFRGHSIKWGEAANHEPDYCDRCYMKGDPHDDRHTWPQIYDRLRGW